MPYIAVLPRNYFETRKKYPVFYLMHGLFGSFENWTTLTDLIEQAKDYEFIIICPEGKNNWYADNRNLENHFYESYILKELIPDVETRFRAENERGSRAVGGLSMGGYGAFKFAFHQPDVFCCAVSLSGAFDIRSFLENKEHKFAELQPFIAKAFENQSVEAIEDEDVFCLAKNFPAEKIKTLPYFYFDCGKQDSFITANRNFSKTLEKRKIAHKFQEFSGGHDWNYWTDQLNSVLKIVSDKLVSETR